MKGSYIVVTEINLIEVEDSDLHGHWTRSHS